jgi:O-antigen/teichoic acid export membrane protein
LVNVITGSVGYVLMMAGEERVFAFGMVGLGAITIGVYFALIPALGPTGAGLATLITLILRGVVTAVIAFRRVGVVALPLSGRLGIPSHR